MRYWWVNQNQTYRHEVQGGYLWSPKRNANGARNPFYESMREVAPGDLIFSFMDTRILAVGIAQSYCWESPKPLEFGTAGQNWENIGWKVKVSFTELANKVGPRITSTSFGRFSPKDIRLFSRTETAFNPSTSPRCPTTLAEVLIGLIGQEVAPIAAAARDVKPVAADDLDFWERKLEQAARQRSHGPGNRTAGDHPCPEWARPIQRTGEQDRNHDAASLASKIPCTLVASHCKPWRDSTNEERLNGENGLLLTPSIDHLFDRGFIGFEDNGKLIISPVAHRPSLQRMGIDTTKVVNVGGFTSGQKQFLDFHRNAVLLQSIRA